MYSAANAKKHKGFNLVEVLIVLSLLLLVISLGAPAIESGKRKSGIQAAVMIMAEDLRAARQKAIDTQQPVALVIPSDGGTKAHSAGYYIMEGYNNPRITKSVNLLANYQSTYIFTGFWDLTSGTNTTTPPKTNANDFPFDLQTWGGNSNDYVFLFTPAGTVKTNNLPNFDNAWHIVLTNGLTYSMTSVAGRNNSIIAILDKSSEETDNDSAFDNPAQFGKIDKAWTASYTLTVTPLGNVDVNEGITKWSGSFETGPVTASATTIALTPAPPQPVPITPVNNPPQLMEIEILPHPNANYSFVMPGADATCHPAWHNTFIIKAKDTDGDRLFISMSCEKDNVTPAAPESGWSFSLDENTDVPMERTLLETNTGLKPVPAFIVRKPSNDVDTHILSADWTPPPGVITSNRYKIHFMVDDKKGGTVTATRTIEILSRDTIIYGSSKSGKTENYCVGFDGSIQQKIIMPTESEFHGCLSPDGRTIIFNAYKEGNYDIYSCNVDGSNLKKLTNDKADDYHPLYSPDGTKIAFNSKRTGKNQVFIMNADGTDLRRLTNSSYDDSEPAFSPDGAKVTYTQSPSYPTGPDDIRIVNTDGTGDIRVTDGSWHNADSCWSPDGSLLVFNSTCNGVTANIFTIKTDGTSMRNLHFDSSKHQCDPYWSPDGQRIVFNSYWGSDSEVYVMKADGSGLRCITNNGGYPTWGRR